MIVPRALHDAPLIDDHGPPENCSDPYQTIAELKSLALLTKDIADALSRSSSVQQAQQRCAAALVQNLNAAFARIWTLNEQSQVLELQASAGCYTHLDGAHSRIPLGQLKIGRIARERKAHLTNSVIGDPHVSDQDWARREQMVAFAGHPLICEEGRVVGVMAVFSRQPLSQATLEALETVANSIANGIAHWRTVESLRASEERFALAVQGTADGLWDWNVLTNEAYHSPRFQELLGYPDHDLENHYQAFESRLHPDDRDRVVQGIQQHLKQRQAFHVDCRLRMKSGAYRWFQSRGQALWNSDGRPVRMLGSIRDITEQKLGEARLSAAHHVTRVLAETTELAESLPVILQSLCEHLNWEVGEFWMRDHERDVLQLMAFCHLAHVRVPAFRTASLLLNLPRGIGLPGRTWSHGRQIWVEDVVRDPDFLRTDAAEQDNLHGAVAIPILIRGEVYGVMEFFSHCPLAPEPELHAFLEDMTLQISRGIELHLKQQVIQRHRQELEIARQIQQGMLPRVMPVLPGFEIAGASVPATEAGGDYLDFVPLANGQLLLGIGDVSGHGLGPAQLVASARASIRILAGLDMALETVVSLVNERLVEDTNEEFMTLLLGVIDPREHSLVYFNAGHCRGLILDAAGAVRTTLESGGLPLGIRPESSLQQASTVQLLPGDLLLLHSDGLTEAHPCLGDLFGVERMLHTLRTARHLPAQAIIARLFRAVEDFTQSGLRDDMTVIVVKVADAA